MDYELAKQLKDLGFPQRGRGRLLGDGKEQPCVYEPTLSELIEECGRTGFQLYFDNNVGWCADIHEPAYRKNRRPVTTVAGNSTPKEAVAKLWLELNKKHLKKEVARKIMKLNKEGDNWNAEGIIEILAHAIDQATEYGYSDGYSDGFEAFLKSFSKDKE